VQAEGNNIAFRYILVRLPVRDLINEFNFPDSEFRPVIRTDMLVDTIIPLCVMILTPLSVTSRPRTIDFFPGYWYIVVKLNNEYGWVPEGSNGEQAGVIPAQSRLL